MPATSRTRPDAKQFERLEDARELPAYGLAEAAFYLDVPRATLRSWVLGRRYPVQQGSATFRPVIHPPTRNGETLLSFFNLIEAHVLDAIRRVHGVELSAVRRALAFVAKRYPGTPHPLATQAFETDGKDLFLREWERLIAASAGGQLGLRDVLDAHLRRIEWDERGLARRLYLFTRGGTHLGDEPRVVAIDPNVSFGRPVLAGTGIPTAVIAERFKAGASVEELAADYCRSAAEIQEAIRCEQLVRAA